MRELLRLADLLKQAERAKTPDDVRAALIAVVQHLYDREFQYERGSFKHY